MVFEEVERQVKNFLSNSANEDPASDLNVFFTELSKERRIESAEKLLIPLVERTARPQTHQDMINSRSVGVIAMRMPYAYPLLITVLGWWVYSVHDTETATELTTEEKLALHKRLKDGLSRWDWLGYDAHSYDHLLNRLVPPEPSQEQQLPSKPSNGILRRLKLFLCGSK